MKSKLIRTGKGKNHWLLSEGACSVKIYSSKQKKDGETYHTHCVTYSEAGDRVRKTFSNLEKAKAWGQTILIRLINGQTEIEGISPVDLQDMALAKRELADLNVSMTAAIREYRRASEQLKGKGTINDAVRYFLTHASPDLPKKSISELCKELCEGKTTDGLSKRYVGDLRTRLAKFARAFDVEIAAIRTTEIESWLRRMGTGSQNRNNYANAVTTLFNFAKRAGYLPHDRITAADNLARAKNDSGEVRIYQPDELRRILVRLRDHQPELLPFVAIGAFAGVRPAELLRLKWENIDYEQRLIEVGAQQAKTAQRRHIPIQANLAAWLEPYRNNKGVICPIGKIQPKIKKLIERSVVHSGGKTEPGVKWQHNALRHSYGSYRLPIIKSAAELALEMGNSPVMIFRHYRELVKPKQADEYWAIVPDKD